MKNFDKSPLTGCKVDWKPTERYSGRKYTPSKGKKFERKQQKNKYNYLQVIEDRLSGMTWGDIAKKHGVPSGRGTAIYQMLTNSVVFQNTSVDVIARLNIKE